MPEETPIPSKDQETQPQQTVSDITVANVIEVWKKVIDVQQHFNDLALRIRNYALTLFTAIIGVIGLLEKEKIHISLFHHDLSASIILAVMGLIVLFGFFYMDRYWYHNLLLGAVKQGAFIEGKYKNKYPEIGLTGKISEESPHKFFCFKIHSKHKFFIFYGLLAFPLFAIAVGLFLAENYNAPNKNSVTKQNTSIVKVDTTFKGRDTTAQYSKTKFLQIDSTENNQ